jgi:hypothetical protein
LPYGRPFALCTTHRYFTYICYSSLKAIENVQQDYFIVNT